MIKNATVNRNINLANSTKKYNFCSPLTHLVEECEKEDVNTTPPSKIFNGKISIKFILPNPLPRYANTNNKQATKWRRRIINRQLRQLLADEATVFKTEDKEGEKYRSHANKKKTTIIKEIAFNMWYEEFMSMSHSRHDDGNTGTFDTGATSGVATEKEKKALIPTGENSKKVFSMPMGDTAAATYNMKMDHKIRDSYT